jgi:hypothetical protein
MVRWCVSSSTCAQARRETRSFARVNWNQVCESSADGGSVSAARDDDDDEAQSTWRRRRRRQCCTLAGDVRRARSASIDELLFRHLNAAVFPASPANPLPPPSAQKNGNSVGLASAACVRCCRAYSRVDYAPMTCRLPSSPFNMPSAQSRL